MSYAGKFATGRQPCDRFWPMDSEFAGPPEHECAMASTCNSTVSFCRACSSDHHANGYESCQRHEHEGRNGLPCEFCPPYQQEPGSSSGGD